MKKLHHNRIYHGDNLYYLPDMPSESIDLIYIDPPFGTQSLWKSKAFKEKVQDFQFYDIWGGGPNGYINFMVERLRHMHRLLKPSGSLFVHLDWRMAHYIKIELDKIFGVRNPAASNSNFRNEIIWHYPSMSRTNRDFPKKHDLIFRYAKSEKFIFNGDAVRVPYALSTRSRAKYGGAGFKRKEGKPNYLNSGGKIPDSVWTIPHLKGKESVGYPTQKPLALLDRIIKATTKKGDLVADFFCGCGTAIVAAQRLDRKWIGMDASRTACEVMLKRIKEDQPLFNHDIKSKPMSAGDFKKLDYRDFEKAAVRYIGGVTNHAQVADGGIDGRMAFDGAPIQVKKSGQQIGDDDRFRGFYMPLKQHGRGYYISLHGFTNKAKERASSWRREDLDIQLLTIEDLIAGRWREHRRQVQAKQTAFFKDMTGQGPSQNSA